MRFTAYDIYEVKDDTLLSIKANSGLLFDNLNKYPKVVEDKESYAPLYIHNYKEYILGTLAQSYNTILTKFDDNENTKKEVELDDTSINDKTYFYVNCDEMRLYVQGKRYPTSLNLKFTMERLEKIIGECLEKKIIFIKAKIKYSIEEIEDIFTNSYVKRIAFTNLEGLTLPKGSTLHNPRKDLDEAMVESYNTYSAPVLDTIDLKAKDGQKLSKNPLAKIGMVLSKENRYAKVFKSMEIIEDGQKVDIKPDGNEHKIIYVPKKDLDDSYETYDRILKKSSRNYLGRLDE